ncbi:sugar 3,4-ketoisomerase [Sphingomonas sp. 37zxx]|uniref:sugar 3,4-ketoisomerase n=1 Tax=Sphingomonas sp. 37zxx TaxID=1550073 RepID=UPI00053C06A5|nr:FdtA/QdtA family cupin domain-containing protein [Sphingomonas sp. 37zxx]
MNQRTISPAGHLDEVRWLDLPSHGDPRGTLTAVESGQDVPFDVRRVYVLHDIVADRGGHAHRDTHQLVTAVAGGFDLSLSDGSSRRTYRLNRPTRGLLFGPMLFITMTGFLPDTRVLVMASTHYDGARSIRSWPDYLAAIGQ